MRTRLRVFGSTLLLITLLSFGNGTAWAATNVVVPNANTNIEGDANNGFPVDLAFFAQTGQRYQQIYAASEFPANPGIITQIRFRPKSFGIGQPFSAVLPNIR